VQQALRVGKRAHTETTIDAAGPSLVAAGLAHVEPVVGPIERAHVLVVGAGTMSSLAATTVRRLGAASITVANRTPARARRLAGSVDGAWTTLDGDALRAALAAADVVVTCTGAVGHVVDPGDVAAARTVRDGRPQLFVDLALPRDVDPAVAALEGVTVLDLEALGSALAGAEAVEGVEQAGAIVTQEVEAWMAGRRAAAVAPTVAALRARAREVVAGEVTRMRARLGDGLDEVVQAELEHTVHRVVEKLLHTPTVRVKSLAAAAPEGGSYAAALRELFDLDLDDVASVSSVMGELPVVHGELPVPPQEPAGGLRGQHAVPVTRAGEVGR
jgi:glutamyl-tRNA reductase